MHNTIKIQFDNDGPGDISNIRNIKFSGVRYKDGKGQDYLIDISPAKILDLIKESVKNEIKQDSSISEE